jgi:hypothetical protein
MNGVELVRAMLLNELSESDFSRTDTEWVNQWDRRWKEVRSWAETHWRNQLDAGPLQDLYRELTCLVPLDWYENGVERHEVTIEPDRAPAHLRGAAQMLADEEFVAQLLDEDPKSAAQLWQELRLKVSEELKRLEGGTEFTWGRQELSLKSHIVAALESMESLDLVTAHMVKQMVDLDEKEWLRTDLGEVIYHAFMTG